MFVIISDVAFFISAINKHEWISLIKLIISKKFFWKKFENEKNKIFKKFLISILINFFYIRKKNWSFFNRQNKNISYFFHVFYVNISYYDQ